MLYLKSLKKISTFRSPRDIILPEKSNAEINIWYTATAVRG
jgi:hypothetical protein